MSLLFKDNPLWCFKGGGGGGGTGAVTHSAYMETVHGQWLDNAGGDTPAVSMVDTIDAAIVAGSPFAAALAYDPDTDIAAWETAVSDFNALLAAIAETTDWAALYTQAEASIPDIATVGITEAVIVADGVAFAAQLDDQITTITLPRFQSGMRDINAVVSSAFVLGQSNIEGFRDRDVAKHDSAMRLNAAYKNADLDLRAEELVMGARVNSSDQMLRFLLSKYAWEEGYMRAVVESRRIKIVAKSEEAEHQLEIDEADAVWDLELFQHGANLLAGIGGGVMNSQKKKKSKAASAIGGAMAMGAAGYMMAGAQAGGMTGPQGAVVGAVAGLVIGYLTAD